MEQIPPAFMNSLVRWFSYHQAVAINQGTLLSLKQRELASAIGIKHPKNIRIMFVDEMPKVKSRLIWQIIHHAGFSFGDAIGLCLGYGIFIQSEGKGDHRLLAHELTHTLQFERCTGVRSFLMEYVQQLLTHGYMAMPFEKEARSNEKLGPRFLGS